MTRLKVLVSAFYCEPGKGSEEGVGWNMAREIARHHEVWTLTRLKNRRSIEAEMSRVPVPRLHFVYCDLPSWGRWWARGQLLEWHLYYYLWQIYIYFVARRLHREVRFDLLHHVTFVKYWIPSFLALLPVPFVWGPVGGGESAPRSFWRDFRAKARLSESFAKRGALVGRTRPFGKVDRPTERAGPCDDGGNGRAHEPARGARCADLLPVRALCGRDRGPQTSRNGEQRLSSKVHQHRTAPALEGILPRVASLRADEPACGDRILDRRRRARARKPGGPGRTPGHRRQGTILG